MLKLADATPKIYNKYAKYRRRFALVNSIHGVDFQPYSSNENYDCILINESSDLFKWSRYKGEIPLLFDSINGYILDERKNFKNIFRGIFKWISGAHTGPCLSYKNL